MNVRALSDGEGSCHRNDTNAVYKDDILLPIGASISIVSYLIIFYLYYIKKVPTLKRHPTSLGVKKCLYEMLFVSQYLWIPFVPDSFFWSDEDDCRASHWAGFFFLLDTVCSYWRRALVFGTDDGSSLCYHKPFHII
mmetsp:Transcript_24984/g.36877  ORF Transcript_24984/g.36877 Transcript_24984/m.36877 type:complete len:137 (-) Transcript_24984:2738-3148(-)